MFKTTFKRRSGGPIDFDAEFYISMYRDIIRIDNAEKHYDQYGWKEGRWPHPYFDTRFYIESGQYDKKSTLNPFQYFRREGLKREHTPLRQFDRKWYLEQYQDVKRSGIDPYLHFVKYGDLERRFPNKDFEVRTELSERALPGILSARPLAYSLHSTVLSQGFQPVEMASQRHIQPVTPRPPTHAITQAALAASSNNQQSEQDFRHLIKSLGHFDPEWYLTVYPDVKAAAWDPLEHFIIHGAREFRNPNPNFDGEYYAQVNPSYSDLCQSPYEHYLRFAIPSGKVINPDAYMRWCERFDSLNKAEDASRHLSSLNAGHIHVVWSVDDASASHVSSFIDALELSIFTKWSLSIILGKGVDNAKFVLIQNITCKHNNISVYEYNKVDAAFNLNGDQTLLCFGAILLNKLTLYHFLAASNGLSACTAYMDNDDVDEYGTRGNPCFKPAYSPEYLEHSNYVGDVIFLKGSLSRHFKESVTRDIASGSAHDAVLRCTGLGNAVINVPFIGYHRVAKLASNKQSERPSKPRSRKNPSVCILIPMRDKAEITKQCIESIITYTNYDGNYKLYIIDNGSSEKGSFDFFKKVSNTGKAEVLSYQAPFNFAAINNFGVKETSEEVIVFLNNDTQIIDSDWLTKLVDHAVSPDVGAVGAKLLYEDNTIQHGGCVVGGAGGLVEHLLAGRDNKATSHLDHTREMSAFTGACLAIRRSVFLECGGFDEILAVAWNDIDLCLKVQEKGYRNIYLADALMYHFESKSRGFDVTPDKKAVFYREAGYVRQKYARHFQNDFSYSSNLSLESAGQLAVPPRVKRPWKSQGKRVLMASIVHNIGYGVPVVIQQQVAEFLEQGWEVTVGGPKGQNEIDYGNCKRVYLAGAKQAAAYAFEHDIDLVVAHTPPFFSVTQYLGSSVPVLIYDYGEPDPNFFPEPTKSYLENVLLQKRFSSAVAATVATISEAVKGQQLRTDAVVAGLGNSHLAAWSEAARPKRLAARRARKWEGKFVVLDVCRFPKTERYYKGIEKYAEVMSEFKYWYPDSGSKLVWCLVGNATPDDVTEMKNLGFHVESNVSDEELVSLYCASDAYMSFSRWEGYNLGIGQALALGLPVIASDIEAHREFPIVTSNSTMEILGWLDREISSWSEHSNRNPVVVDWVEKRKEFVILATRLLNSHCETKEAIGQL